MKWLNIITYYSISIFFLIPTLFVCSQQYPPLIGKSGETIIGNGMITCFDATKDGKYLVVGTNLGVMIHDAETFERVGEFREHENITKLVVSDDGSHVLSWSVDGSLKLWDFNSRIVQFSKNYSDEIYEQDIKLEILDVDLSPDGNLIAVVFKPIYKIIQRELGGAIVTGGVDIWDTRTKMKLTTIMPRMRSGVYEFSDDQIEPFEFKDPILDTVVTFSPDSTQLLISGYISFFESFLENQNGILRRVEKKNTEIPLARLYDLSTNSLKPINEFNEEISFIFGLSKKINIYHFNEDGSSFFLGPFENTTIVENIHTGVSESKQLYIITEVDTETGTKITNHSFLKEMGIPTEIKQKNKSELYITFLKRIQTDNNTSFNYQPEIYSYHLMTNELKHLTTLFLFPFGSGYNPNYPKPTISTITETGHFYILDLVSMIKWDINNDTKHTVFDDYEFGIGTKANWIDEDTKIIGIRSLSHSWISASYGASAATEVIVLDTNTKQIIQTFSGHLDLITSFDVSSDESKVLTGSIDKTARVWDMKNGNTITSVTDESMIDRVAFFPSSNYFITISDETPAIWNSENGEFIARLDGPNQHERFVHDVAVSPKEDFIVTSGFDHTLRIWKMNFSDSNTRTIEHVKTIQGDEYEFF